MVIYIIFGANAVYRLFFHGNTETENGISVTSEKVLAGIALSLILNLTVYLISTNFIKIKQGIVLIIDESSPV